ncbi:hypothetical protein [Halobiforma nitratireducens]|uniref:Uncharacterized protein n=1 Tax=Halobiforma nitratireducens JCM 10879 TaxID=1227454 RepID=M0LJY8_9EURY|nr:hypothetical protein [Halobiforma nitratireducens]EMA33373.1 hypothetical protein C446_14124 [Halobiforma nitratireducens JCM 10879]
MANAPSLLGTAERVPSSTADAINAESRRELADRLRYYADDPDEIDDRLAELEREWDIERTLESLRDTAGGRR